MAGITEITELEARKRALVAESNICRETLHIQIQELREYGEHFFQKIDRVRSFGPWLMLAAPVAIPIYRWFVNRKHVEDAPAHGTKFKGKIATAFLAFRMYRKYGPMVRSLAEQFLAKRRAAAKAGPEPARR